MAEENRRDVPKVAEKQSHHTYRQGGEVHEQAERRSRKEDSWSADDHAEEVARRDSADTVGGVENRDLPAFGRAGQDYGHGAEHESRLAQIEGGDSVADAGSFNGESSYNQGFREPYGAYQGGYPGEGRTGSGRHSPEYASWRAAHIKKLDEDYEAWCTERQGNFLEDFEEWRRQRKGPDDQP